MRKIWLYVDGNEQLNLSFYKNEKDDKPIRTFVGRQCYPYIEKICNGKIKKRKSINNMDDHTLIYDNYYIDIFHLESVLEKNGTKPILEDINIYECTKNAKKIKNKKVTRKTKYIGGRIAAAGLALTILGGVAVNSLGNKKTDVYSKNISIENEIEDLLVDSEYDEENSKVEINVNNEDTNEKVVVELDYNDKSQEKKAHIARSYYGETIEKYAKQYGVDPIIMTAIATQERGIHSGVKDEGGATGLMQIQNNSWKNQKLTAFNYNTNQYETIIVNESKLSDVYYNIQVGCMIFQNNMTEMNNNVLAAIQCYNMGATNMFKILKEYSRQTGKSIDEILTNVSDCGWLECRDVIKVGDQNYLEHVLSWIGTEVDLFTYLNNGEEVDLVVSMKM